MSKPANFTILVNAIAARHGGALVVHKAILAGLTELPDGWSVVAVVNHDLPAFELSALPSKIEVVRIPTWLQRIAVYIQPALMAWYCYKFNATCVLNQNVMVPFLRVPQIVYHINMFNFMKNDALTSKRQLLFQALRHRASQAALKKASFNVFESKYLMELAGVNPNTVSSSNRLVYIGIDQNKLLHADELNQRLQSHVEHTRICITTSNNPHKNNLLLPVIAAKIKLQLPDTQISFHIFGGGDKSAWTNLVRVIQDNNVEDMFHFHGYVSQEKLSEELDQALCLLCTSYVESFCTVALEAMARAVPVICSDSTALPESVGDAGIVVRQDDAEAMAQAICQLYSNKTRWRKVASASHHRASTLTWLDACQNFQDLFQEVEQSGKAAGN